MKGRTATIIASAVVAVSLLLFAACVGLFEAPFYLLVGWGFFLQEALSNMTTVEPAELVAGIAALGLFVALLHLLARWFYSQLSASDRLPRRWRLRWSLAVTGIVAFSVLAGTNIVAIVCETKWLASSGQPVIWQSGAAREALRPVSSATNLKGIGVAISNYEGQSGQFPPGGTSDKHGEALHSWETCLLPYLEDTVKPDLSLPWDHVRNAKYFKIQISEFVNPRVEGQMIDEYGYALSHYAVNSRVFYENSHKRIADITDGTSNTIAAGEVREKFKPWGHPVNWRDPALGINRSPDGFGSPWPGGANFLLMDGSVRFVKDDTDPAILKVLATPSGNDDVPTSFHSP